MPLILDLEAAYEAAKQDRSFAAQLQDLQPIMSAVPARFILPSA